jgi:hypothetical protein
MQIVVLWYCLQNNDKKNVCICSITFSKYFQCGICRFRRLAVLVWKNAYDIITFLPCILKCTKLAAHMQKYDFNFGVEDKK